MTPIGPKNRPPDHGVGEPGLPQPRRLHACGRGKSLLLPGRGVKGRRVSHQASRCSSGRSAGLRPSDARRARYRGSACSHSRQATERLSDSRRARPVPVAGLRPPQERLKLRLWHPGSRLESQRRVALPAFCDTRLNRLHTVASTVARARGLKPASGAGSRSLTVALSHCRAATARSRGPVRNRL